MIVYFKDFIFVMFVHNNYLFYSKCDKNNFTI